MKVSVKVTKAFKTASKPLFKRYPSLSADLNKLEKQLQLNPKLGTPLGNNAYKIRLKITSKGKGKSGGARVISLLETTLIIELRGSNEEIIVNLIYIFDKSDTATITDKELRDLIAAFHKNK